MAADTPDTPMFNGADILGAVKQIFSNKSTSKEEKTDALVKIMKELDPTIENMAEVAEKWLKLMKEQLQEERKTANARKLLR